MSVRYLGQPFDIHGGGADLIFPHHENEIAQSEAVGGQPLAHVWLHNGHVNVRGEKMSKSLRNFVDVSEILERYPAPAFRLFLCEAHYRSQLDYDTGALESARSAWERFRAFVRAAPDRPVAPEAVAARLEGFGSAMDDDLNTPAALAALHTLVGEGHRALEGGRVEEAAEARAAVQEGLGVLGIDVRGGGGAEDIVGLLVELVLEEREAARAARDFARADAIRARLASLGIRVEDSEAGPRWFRE